MLRLSAKSVPNMMALRMMTLLVHLHAPRIVIGIILLKFLAPPTKRVGHAERGHVVLQPQYLHRSLSLSPTLSPNLSSCFFQ